MAGSDVTFAGCWTQLGTVVAEVDAIEQFGGTNATNLLDLHDVINVGADGEVIPYAMGPLLAARRSRVAGLLSGETLRNLFRPYLREMTRVIGAPEVFSDVEMLRRIRQYMVDNSQTINSRGMTLGQPAVSGSPTGDGSIRRLTVDKDGYALESTNPEVLTIECTRDQTSGTRRYEEEFGVRGQPLSDGLSWTGSGIGRSSPFRVRALHAASGRILRNPSFDVNDAAGSDNVAPGSLTGVTNWDIASSAANFKLRTNSSYVYRDYPGAPSTSYGLEFVGNDTISQTIRSANRGAAFGEVPYFLRVAAVRLASATGTLSLILGSQSTTLDVSTLTNGQFAHHYITLGTKCYYDNFRQNNMTVGVQMSSLAVGTVGVDDVLLAPMTNVDGTYYVWDGGDTAWLKGDTYTVTSTDGGARGKLSYWLWRAYGPEGWLPSDNAGLETIADPA